MNSCDESPFAHFDGDPRPLDLHPPLSREQEFEALLLTAFVCRREGIWNRESVDMIYACVLQLLMEVGD